MSNSALHFFVKAATGGKCFLSQWKIGLPCSLLYAEECGKGESSFLFLKCPKMPEKSLS
jgi:hypothetical protein